MLTFESKMSPASIVPAFIKQLQFCDLKPGETVLFLTDDSSPRETVEAGLAACVNLLPRVQSVYRWQGKTERTREIQLVIKSRAALFEPLRQCILAHHPYEVPEILALPASQGHPAYLDWLTQETS